MRYRKYGNLDWEVSALAFGAMRLPVVERDRSGIDEPKATEMIRTAIDGGINYIDTAHPYHGGTSQEFVGRALGEGYRQKVHLATKLWIPAVNSRADMDEFLNRQLEKLQTDCIDFYLLHAVDRSRWEKLKSLPVFEWAEAAKKAGKIRYFGFSFHDNTKLFREIVDSYDGWTFCQLQYNYMETTEVLSRPGGYHTPGREAADSSTHGTGTKGF